MGFLYLLQDFASNDMGRGAILLALAGVVRWPMFFLGNLLKSGPDELAPTIPHILLGVGVVAAAILLGPLGAILPGLTFSELMLVAGGSTLLAKKTHDDRKAGKARDALTRAEVAKMLRVELGPIDAFLSTIKRPGQ
jgi:hypothetical protein